MRFGSYLERLVPRTNAEKGKKTYLCWKCGKSYIDPADYLWHIQYC
ncbi:MAG: hypothetical protein KGH54_00025 [Candidatus Micrarchaeota archaeon]|nr:hypothetical protein [Candidatus Micrarchaeota archaeon]